MEVKTLTFPKTEYKVVLSDNELLDISAYLQNSRGSNIQGVGVVKQLLVMLVERVK